MNEKHIKPLDKMEFLQTMTGTIITDDMLNKAYDNYLLKYYGYQNHDEFIYLKYN